MIYINLGLVELPVSPVLVLIIGVIVTFIVEKNNKGRASGAILIVLLGGLVLGQSTSLLAPATFSPKEFKHK